MATKAFEHTHSNRIVGTSTADRNAQAWFIWKQGLSGALTYVADDATPTTMTHPYVVVASSNSVTADSSDNWASKADIVSAAAGAGPSWWHGRIVDYYGSGDHLHMLMSCENDALHAEGYVAYARGATGFNSDGDTSSKPTAAVTPNIVRRGLVTSGNADSSDCVFGFDADFLDLLFYLKVSTDGKVMRWHFCAGGKHRTFAGFQPFQSYPGAAIAPDDFVAFFASQDSATLEPLDYADVWDSIPIGTYLNGASALRKVDVGQPFTGGTSATVNAFTANNDLGIPGLAQMSCSDETTSVDLGVITDLWAASDLKNTGDQGENDAGVVQKTVFGDCMERTPNDETVVVV